MVVAWKTSTRSMADRTRIAQVLSSQLRNVSAITLVSDPALMTTLKSCITLSYQ